MMDKKEIKELIDKKVQDLWTKVKPKKFLEHDLDTDMKECFTEYSAGLIEIWERLKQKYNLDDEMMESAIEGWNETGMTSDEWDDGVYKLQDKVSSNKKYIYWDLNIEHEDDWIRIEYYNCMGWYRYDGETYEFESICDIDEIITESIECGTLIFDDRCGICRKKDVLLYCSKCVVDIKEQEHFKVLSEVEKTINESPVFDTDEVMLKESLIDEIHALKKEGASK